MRVSSESDFFRNKSHLKSRVGAFESPEFMLSDKYNVRNGLMCEKKTEQKKRRKEGKKKDKRSEEESNGTEFARSTLS